ncbi:hypothetical protein AGMMS49545_08670 [Betaproteobacteria bacterium]|nr:hypothetical protein AGMMS49545_08670 [Betaproteobacteria bacterium]GHU41339.1 hypothetical protein AGMMS50289_04330 [Betaproteobacteria bacterium]
MRSETRRRAEDSAIARQGEVDKGSLLMRIGITKNRLENQTTQIADASRFFEVFVLLKTRLTRTETFARKLWKKGWVCQQSGGRRFNLA